MNGTLGTTYSHLTTSSWPVNRPTCWGWQSQEREKFGPVMLSLNCYTNQPYHATLLYFLLWKITHLSPFHWDFCYLKLKPSLLTQQPWPKPIYSAHYHFFHCKLRVISVRTPPALTTHDFIITGKNRGQEEEWTSRERSKQKYRYRSHLCSVRLSSWE